MTEEQNSRDIPWYRAAFDDLYPLLYRHRDDESARQEAGALIELFHLSPGATRVLDVCCGAGRHTAAFALAGFPVWGTDLSFRLLANAAQRPELKTRVVQSDIRTLPFRPAFELVLNLFTSFGYFREEGENLRALRELIRVLRPGGRLVLDHMNRSQVERTLVAEDAHTSEGITVRQRRWIDKNRILKKIDVLDGRGRHVALREDVRLYTPDEMIESFHSVGLEQVRQYGAFAGDPLTPDSSRMITTGVRPGR